MLSASKHVSGVCRACLSIQHPALALTPGHQLIDIHINSVGNHTLLTHILRRLYYVSQPLLICDWHGIGVRCQGSQYPILLDSIPGNSD